MALPKEEPKIQYSGPVTASNGVFKSRLVGRKNDLQVCGPVYYNENEIAATVKFARQRITGYPGFLIRG
jgi:hypothetical protein